MNEPFILSHCPRRNRELGIIENIDKYLAHNGSIDGTFFLIEKATDITEHVLQRAYEAGKINRKDYELRVKLHRSTR